MPTDIIGPQKSIARIAHDNKKGDPLDWARFNRGTCSSTPARSWGITCALGLWAAGNLMDRGDPNWLWYACGIIGAVSALGFLSLHGRDQRKATAPTRPTA